MASASDDQGPHYLETELVELFQSSPHVIEFLDQGSLDGIWYWDIENPEQEWLSPRFREVFGYEQDEIPNTSTWWQANIHPDDLQVVLENLHKHLDNPEHPYDQVVRYRHKDGSTVWVRCRGLGIRDESGRARRVLGVHTDVTALKKAQEGLAAQVEALDQFAYMASHDLREPLRAISGFSQIMSAEVADPSEQFTRAAHLVRAGVSRMSQLIDDMLALSRINTKTAKESFAISKALREVLDDLGPLLESTQAQVTADVDPELLVVASPTHVRSLLQNLISNAAKYHPAGRGNHVHVTITKGSEAVTVTVADDGIGVPPEQHERMMQPFVRLHQDDEVRGSGVGLAAVTRIVDHARGSVTVDSRTDQGLRLTAALPGWLGRRNS